MSIAIHHAGYFRGPAAIRDIVIGMADGLTAAFALAADASGATAAAEIVGIANVAEIAAGAIAMRLGGYLAARTDLEPAAGEYANAGSETS